MCALAERCFEKKDCDMAVAIILPPPIGPDWPREETLQRAFGIISKRFGSQAVIYVPPGSQEVYAPHIPFQTVIYDRPSVFNRHEYIVFLSSSPTNECYLESKISDLPKENRVYSYDYDCTITLRNRDLDEIECPNLNSHAFNRLGSRGPRMGVLYYPFGTFSRVPTVGHIDPWGFRIPFDYSSLSERDSNTTVIAVFGGSAAFSIYAQPEESHPALLENFLNAYCTQHGINHRFIVLNFGVPGYTMMDEIIAYMLHAYRLNPDVIIAHDGFNDLFFGLGNDPAIIVGKRFSYQPQLEEFAQKLHDSQSEPINDRSTPRNLPQNVIAAHLDRKRQFSEIVTARGKKFIWGLQPSIVGRGNRSPFENAVFQNLLNPGNTDAPVFQRLDLMYPRLSRVLETTPGIEIVDVHRHCERFGDGRNVLWDSCHTTPLGDRLVAEAYFAHLKTNLPILTSVLTGCGKTC